MSARPGTPSVGALLEQRHQYEDPAEPPLGGAQPDWGDDWRPNGGHDFDCAYVGGVGPCTCADDDAVPVRPVEDVRVRDGVL